jgi:hypothetical protein
MNADTGPGSVLFSISVHLRVSAANPLFFNAYDFHSIQGAVVPVCKDMSS